jgi:P-type E1-E2 ATPase
LRILLFASIKSMAIDLATSNDQDRPTAWIDGFAILVAVFVCATVTSVNDYQKELQFQDLNKVAGDRKRVNIIRNGELLILHQSLVMVGDLIQLEEGMEIPADGLVVEAAELTTD